MRPLRRSGLAYVGLCTLTLALAVGSVTSSYTWATTLGASEVQQPPALTSQEWELWGALTAPSNAALGAHNYRDGIPIIAKTVLTTSLDASIANALQQCNALRGIFTIRPDLTSDSFDEEVRLIAQRLEGTRRKPTEYELATLLLHLNEERYRMYRDATKDFPVLNSRGGYLAQLVSSVRQGKTEPAALTTALKSFVREYEHNLDIKTVPAEFSALKDAIDQRSLPVLLGPTENDAVTVAGYFVYKEKQYLIVHDPLTAKVNKPQDDPLFLQDNSSNHAPTPPFGVHLYPVTKYAGQTALVIGKAELDLDVLKKYF